MLRTVPDPHGAVAEARRILKPGGRFVCIEHVGAPWLFEGCDLCRDTGRIIASAGFHEAEITPFRLDTALVPIALQVQAVCVR